MYRIIKNHTWADRCLRVKYLACKHADLSVISTALINIEGKSQLHQNYPPYMCIVAHVHMCPP